MIMYAKAINIKRVLFTLLVMSVMSANAQYNNEWIDFNKTYYKFKVAVSGVQRIPFSTLSAAGLGSTSAQDFQLWRNGVQVPIYTSAPTGPLSTSGFIEFWGEMNDGKVDSQLYKLKEYQLNKKWSLQTDSAAYFLTVNPGGLNRRLTSTPNNVAGNVLPAEPFFMHTEGKYYREKLNGGYAVNAGLYVYSSDYDRGEGPTSQDILTTTPSNPPAKVTFSNLHPYLSGPTEGKFTINLSGNDPTPHRYKVGMRSAGVVDTIGGGSVDYFIYEKDTIPFPLSKLTGSVDVEINNTFGGRFVVHQFEMHYPRVFNFGGNNNFQFNLPASGSGNYLEITNFAYGSIPPVLYDLTNGKRYVADVSNPSVIKIVLEPSSVERNLVLVSQESSNIRTITSVQSRTFTNYSLAANAGDFLIISNPVLFSGATGNPVEDYRAYRSTAAGGGYNAKIYLIADLEDQFAFGIKRHPVSIRNFLMYARANFTVAPKHVFLIGKPVHYVHNRASEGNPDLEKLNLVPTFGWPASDVMLSADPGSAQPKTPIGRLSAVSPLEVEIYLKKVKEYEAVQQTPSPLIGQRAWMKNVVHAVGGGNPAENNELSLYLDKYAAIISDTLFGAKVTSFTKTSGDAVQQISGSLLPQLFQEGISLFTYFGHSSSAGFAFNLNNPEQYNNQGKYPLFLALGCLVGDFFGFSPGRLQGGLSLSEKYNLIPDRGSIGFMASSHYGIPEYLDVYSSHLYKSFSTIDYGKTVGEQIQKTIERTFADYTQEDFYARITTQQSIMHGDPALKLNTHPKPDYAIEDPLLTITPGFVSVADPNFEVKAKFINLGKAIDRDIVVEVKRQYPNGITEVVYRDTLRGIRYSDSISVKLNIDPIRDKGTGRVTVTIDADNVVDEIFETNNSVTKDVVVFEEEARPVYPANFAIVNRQNIKFAASTANPFTAPRGYRFEIDTTTKFNSPLKLSLTVNSPGGLIEFNPSIQFLDSTVYYWRVSPVPSGTEQPKWQTNSFVYLANYDFGFNQSHLYQHMSSEQDGVSIDSTGKWKYKTVNNDVFVGNGVWGYGAGQDLTMSVYFNGDLMMSNSCANHVGSLVFNVIDPITFKPWLNTAGGAYGSGSNTCNHTRKYNFEYIYNDTSGRRKIMNFMTQVIPNGAYVIVRNFSRPPANVFINQWKADTAYYGSGNSLYHYLKNAGFTAIDSYYTHRAWILIYQKNTTGFTPLQVVGNGLFENVTLSATLPSSGTSGYVTSPVFGPAKTWKEVQWRGSSVEANSTDNVQINVLGIRHNGTVDTLFAGLTTAQQNFNISSVNAAVYPYIQLRMRNEDTVNHTPYQLRYWRVTSTPVPEGAVAPNIYFSMKDSVELGEMIDFKMAFKNIGDAAFDSLRVKMIITDRNNVAHTLPVLKHRPLNIGDTLHIRFPINSVAFQGMNSLYVHVNPDNDQPEQYQFNNFIYKTFYVVGDTLNPLMDVTFDNAHILNGDVVSAKPSILIRLTDETKFRLLDDTSLVSIRLKFPSGNWRTYRYDNDTLRFIAPQPGTGNVASIEFHPHLFEDGNYEMIITGQDKSGNQAGGTEYRIAFRVINKAMISNMLNYPNPFTTSTAFVFTITGSEVPQNLKIQILTITGKVVREITKEELGQLRIGRNITEFKWDGTDQYGQKLANGVYLYRVVTNLNGKSLEKFKDEDDDTDKYFNKGYGKMYLMR